MKKKSQRLDVIVKLAKKDEDQLANLLEQARVRMDSSEKQLEQLSEYYEAYMQQSIAEQASYTVAHLQSSREFLKNMSSAIAIQKNKRDHDVKSYEQIKLKWLALHKRTQSLKDYVETCAENEMRVLDKNEQKKMDEWISQNHRKK